MGARLHIRATSALERLATAVVGVLAIALLAGLPRWDNTKKQFVGGVDAVSVAGIPSVVTASGSSGWLSSTDISTLNLLLAIAGAVTGTTPTLDVLVETSDSPTGATNVRTIASFAQKTAASAAGAGNERKTFAGLDDYYRIRWTIGGTASPTFNGVSITGSGK